jgi:hypothetical protein
MSPGVHAIMCGTGTGVAIPPTLRELHVPFDSKVATLPKTISLEWETPRNQLEELVSGLYRE